MEEESILRRWAGENGCLIPLCELAPHRFVSNQTPEHDVGTKDD